MLLLNINRKKTYMESLTAPLHLTLSDFKRSKSRSLRFLKLIHVSHKGAELHEFSNYTAVKH